MYQETLGGVIGEETRLTGRQTLVTNVARQLIPYQSNYQTFVEAASASGPYSNQDVYQTIAYPGFVMYWRAYHQGYGLR
ncbi:MAG: hypothetical protein H6766_02975 [Candidatus Peribacteria bacterium]|nr:MAG: hypothetical protein H6766_02975 [Candidatus Peribacteria bacterium]